MPCEIIAKDDKLKKFEELQEIINDYRIDLALDYAQYSQDSATPPPADPP